MSRKEPATNQKKETNVKTTFSSTAQFIEDGAAILLKEVRLSFPHIVAPARVKGAEKETYSANFVCNFDEASKRLISDFIVKAWSEKLKMPEPIPGKSFAVNGNHKAQKEFHGFLVISASETVARRPEVYDRNKRLTSDPNACYSGCLVDAVIRPWIQDNSWGKRVNAGLVAVSFCDDFERLGAPQISAGKYFGAPAGQVYTDNPTPSGEVVGTDGGYFDSGAMTASNQPAGQQDGDRDLPF